MKEPKENKNEILGIFFEIIRNYVHQENTKLFEYKKPDELAELVDFKIQKKGNKAEQLFKYIKQYLKYSVNTGDPQFFNQLYSGFNLPAFLGEVVTALTNTSMYTYEVAPMATLIESEIIQKMCKIAGFENGNGLFVSGGSNANQIAMFSARNKAFPSLKTQGMQNIPLLAIFVSEQAHYSFEHNANLLGIGSKQVFKIKSDSNGRMIPDELEKQIITCKNLGFFPFFIGATAATTLLGAFDPIDEIADIGQKYNIWVHVDGSFGGSLILSKQKHKFFKGIEKVDSFGWNPHKLMNIPLICSVILLKEKNRLYQNLTTLNDDYIYHKTETGSCDLGKKSIQCGRRVDSLKLWLAWKYYGDNGYEQRMEHLLHLAYYFEEKLKKINDIEIMAKRQSLSVCFRFKPQKTIDFNSYNSSIRENLRKSGKSLVNYGYINNQFSFRWVITNADTQEKDIDDFLSNLLESVAQLNRKEPIDTKFVIDTL